MARRKKSDASSGILGIIGLFILGVIGIVLKFVFENWIAFAAIGGLIIAGYVVQWYLNNKKNRVLNSKLQSQLDNPESEVSKALKFLNTECEPTLTPKEIAKNFENTHIPVLESDILTSLEDDKEDISKTASKKIKIQTAKSILTVEQYTLQHFRNLGFEGVHSEVSLWNMCWYSLFFDIYWANVSSAQLHERSDMPADLYTEDYFFENRRQLILKRATELLNMTDIEFKQALHDGYNKTQNRKARIVNADPKMQNITRDLLVSAVTTVGFKNLLPLVFQLMKNQNEFRRGLPDLFIWNTATKEFFFVEAKSEKDRLSKFQCYWFEKLKLLGFSVKLGLITKVDFKSDSA